MDKKSMASLMSIPGCTFEASDKDFQRRCKNSVQRNASKGVTKSIYVVAHSDEEVEHGFSAFDSFHNKMLGHIEKGENAQLSLLLRFNKDDIPAYHFPMYITLLNDFINNWVRPLCVEKNLMRTTGLPKIVIDNTFTFYGTACFHDIFQFMSLNTRLDSCNVTKTYMAGMIFPAFAEKYKKWFKQDMIDIYSFYLDVKKGRTPKLNVLNSVFDRIHTSVVTHVALHNDEVYLMTIGGSHSTYDSATKVAYSFYKTALTNIPVMEYDPKLNANTVGGAFGAPMIIKETPLEEIRFAKQLPKSISEEFDKTINDYKTGTGLTVAHI